MNALLTLRDWLAAQVPCVVVRVEDAQGSTPREAGATMLISAGETHGTIGGGAMEMEAIIEARRLLAAGEDASELSIALGPSIGQCCGGRVRLSLRRATPSLLEALEAVETASRAEAPTVLIFGAGHTGQAMARALAPLPLALTIIDTRSERLAVLPAGVSRIATALPEAEIDAAPPGAAFVVMTHDHALDFILAERALARSDAAYVGMIGSATKREKFRRHLADTGSPACPDALVLPIGGTAVRDKRPEVIAAMTAAELLARFSALEKACTGFAQGQPQCNKDGADAPGRPVRETERHAATS
ncbi:xanthine dehydrogenase accessory protein XdhC [Aureimonas mangrovi]|uniref:xanthine dehydrogenase accessory protein XdhC n=1 Tax=Aureimonas mangrovi TaxID=2758041 RepID=UPI00163D4FA4|nr:xanthine dehydrogenase accessory protein XdhC [Aureimonas mangrovi]